jgi:hypothetical protein
MANEERQRNFISVKKKKALKDDTVLTFKVQILNEFGEKRKNPCWREIAILGRDNLYNFAEAIVKSFGFYFDHCFDFRESPHSRKGELYEFFVDLGEDPTPGAKSIKKAKIEQAFNQVGKKMIFYFDYGDSWYFEVELLSCQRVSAEERHPTLLQSHGVAPEQYPPCEDDIPPEEEYEADAVKSVPKEEIKRKALEKAESILFNLQEAYKVRPDDLSYEEEKQVLDALAKAKKLRDEVKKEFEQSK